MFDGVTVRIMADAKSSEDRHHQLYIFCMQRVQRMLGTSIQLQLFNQKFLGYCEPFRLQMQKYYTSRSILSQFWKLDVSRTTKSMGRRESALVAE